MAGHLIFCTAPLTEPRFKGRCALCGKEGLSLRDASQRCPKGQEPFDGKRPKWALSYPKGAKAKWVTYRPPLPGHQ